ncbi:MAG: leucine-rich repeat domain-containing protein, partial [Muribaculaceae bacterium]|nr:leucine-rich repeat domain-containing protein [Muribaculaceae bacterium]
MKHRFLSSGCHRPGHLAGRLLLLVSLFIPLLATAYDFEVDGIYYEIKKWDYTVKVVGVDPDKVGEEFNRARVQHDGEWYDIYEIGDSVFYGCKNLKSVHLSSAIKRIGKSAFANCPNLSEFHICSGYRESRTYFPSIYDEEEGVFFNSPLSKVNLEVSIEWYGKYSPFHKMNTLESVEFDHVEYDIDEFGETIEYYRYPSKIKEIRNGMFYGCTGLTSVTIPASVEWIGDAAFAECTNLKELRIDDGFESLKFYDNRNVNEFYGLPDDRIFKTFYNCPLEKLYIGRNIEIPNYDKYKWNQDRGELNVDEDGNIKRDYYTLIPYWEREDTNSLLEGESPFFNNDNISQVEFGDNVTSVGNYLFRGFNAITEITLPDSVEDCILYTS